MKKLKMTNLPDELYSYEFKRVIRLFRVFYPSDICKMMVDYPLIDKTMIGRLFYSEIRSGTIRQTGNKKPLKSGGIEWEYQTIL